MTEQYKEQEYVTMQQFIEAVNNDTHDYNAIYYDAIGCLVDSVEDMKTAAFPIRWVLPWQVARICKQRIELYEAAKATLSYIEGMQLITEDYLVPDNGVSQDGYVNGIIYCLDGPDQRLVQGALQKAVTGLEQSLPVEDDSQGELL